jgi:hypothetical protein
MIAQAERPEPSANSFRSDLTLLLVLALTTVLGVLVVEAHVSDSARQIWVSVILGIGFAKAAAIGVWYMRLRRAPLLLLGGFLVWAAAFAAVLVVLASMTAGRS